MPELNSPADCHLSLNNARTCWVTDTGFSKRKLTRRYGKFRLCLTSHMPWQPLQMVL